MQSIGGDSTEWNTAAHAHDLRIYFTVSANPSGLQETLSQEKHPNGKRRRMINRAVTDLKEKSSFVAVAFICV